MFIGSADRFTPQGYCIVDPARAAYSHSASVSSL
jgi:hypothetical protein